jgi:hypothetical protein
MVTVHRTRGRWRFRASNEPTWAQQVAKFSNTSTLNTDPPVESFRLRKAFVNHL